MRIRRDQRVPFHPGIEKEEDVKQKGGGTSRIRRDQRVPFHPGIEKEEDVKQKGGGTSQPKGNPEGSGL